MSSPFFKDTVDTLLLFRYEIPPYHIHDYKKIDGVVLKTMRRFLLIELYSSSFVIAAPE